EWTWLAAHLAVYPAGVIAEQLTESDDGYRTDNLRPLRRSHVVTDVEAAGTPILLVHGIMDNRSVFTVFRRTLRRRGFGVVHAVNYSLFTGDVRDAAHQLRNHVEKLREQTGADKVHIVGHSLGGMIARYYVQRMGGSAVVDTLVTLGSPHTGTLTAYLMPTPLARQLRPGSELLEELSGPAPQNSPFPNRVIRWPNPWASAISRRLCGTRGNFSERPVRKSRPPPTSTNGMLSSVCEFPFPSSFVQTMTVLSSIVPVPPGSGVSASLRAR
ncbi:alpha/beta fold hydrolase, partial [bacterium]|nr:alpha/beta fold hydrolase [bacterium]